jgi:hypothetical protein
MEYHPKQQLGMMVPTCHISQMGSINMRITVQDDLSEK